MFFHKGRSPSLYKIPAHGDHNMISTEDLPGIADLVFVAFVKWVIFCNDSNNFHIKKYLPFLKIKILK